MILSQLRRPTVVVLAAASLLGCQLHNKHEFSGCAPAGCYEKVAAEIEYPAESPCTVSNADESIGSPPPLTLSNDTQPEYWDVTLEDVIHMGLANSQVLHQLGGAVLRAPELAVTQYDPAIRETEPRTGVEAALSQFDAEFSSSFFFDKNDRAINNEFFGGGTRLLQQDLGLFNAQIQKRAVTGSQFFIRNLVDYDANNAPGNFFPGAYTAKVEGEIRQPLLQGAGVEFNRIAGPNETPGIYNGVLIARVNTDVQLTDFEIAVRDLVCNLENAYWDLYYAYRDLDAKIAARNAALETWRRVEAWAETGRAGGEAYNEGQAREQFFRFQEEVQNSLSGRLLDGTRTGNGSSGGTFRATGGVQVCERRLRQLMGMSPTDGRLMRPKDEPIVTTVAFDWDRAKIEAAERRPELRRQKFQIRRRELELIASQNYLLPRLDAVGLYRFRGFGKDLIDPNGGTLPRFDNAYGDLTTGDFQEWQLGFELNVPIGYRAGHAAVRNAELLLARERAVLRDQQREVMHEVSGAFADLDRAFVVSQTNYNRLIAARAQVDAVQAVAEKREVPLYLILDALRRAAEAESAYYRSLAEYAVAMKNVHFTSGTLLEYDGVYLAEGPWPAKAYFDACEREMLRRRAKTLNYASSQAPIISRGQYPQIRDLGPEQVVDPEQPVVLPNGPARPLPPPAPPRATDHAGNPNGGFLPTTPIEFSSEIGEAGWSADRRMLPAPPASPILPMGTTMGIQPARYEPVPFPTAVGPRRLPTPVAR